MLNHLTVLKFKNHVTDADIDDLERHLEELPNAIVEIQMYEFGRNVISAPHSHDFAVMALFANEEALGRYHRHPQYLSLAAEIGRISESIITVDFYGSDAGSLREKPPADFLLGDDLTKF